MCRADDPLAVADAPSGLPWPFKPELNSLKPAVHIGAPHNRPHSAHNPTHNLGRKPRPGPLFYR